MLSTTQITQNPMRNTEARTTFLFPARYQDRLCHFHCPLFILTTWNSPFRYTDRFKADRIPTAAVLTKRGLLFSSWLFPAKSFTSHQNEKTVTL